MTKNKTTSGAKGRNSDAGPARVQGSRSSLMDIAASTLDKIERGSYNIEGKTFNLTKDIQEMKQGTMFFPEDSDLSNWQTQLPPDGPDRKAVKITVTERSTLSGARALNGELNPSDGVAKVGVLSFASAKNPGGGFRTGAQAQVGSSPSA
jgi:uncharacterized protein (TIGR02452 family)